jgi:large subunit ribosomal protein L21
MYAVVETGGKQYQVQEGRYIDVDLLNVSPDTNINIDKVVAIIAGEHSQIGQPYVAGASVQAKVLKHDRGKKVIAYKMRRKKGYRLKKGHRQDYTRILVENIEFPNKDETLNFVKEQQEKVEAEKQEIERKLQEAHEKRLAKKQAQKDSRKKQEKQATIKEEAAQPAAQEVEGIPQVTEVEPVVEAQTEESSDQTTLQETTEAAIIPEEEQQQEQQEENKE